MRDFQDLSDKNANWEIVNYDGAYKTIWRSESEILTEIEFYPSLVKFN